MDLLWLKVPRWDERGGPLHGFLGRRGGKSQGVYAGLNLSFRSGDDPQVVKDNLCDMKKAVGVHDLRIVTMRQMHGSRILDVMDNHSKEAGEADGMVTEKRGLFLGVLTADCVPILFCAASRKLTAVVHVGWRGTLAGLGIKMVRHLKDRYDTEPDCLEVALGPAIGPCCYEVRSDVSAPIIKRWGRLAMACLEERNNRSFLDLRKLNGMLLREAGVPPERLFTVGPCTACAPDDFYSYRRERQAPAAGKGDTGRQLSFIGWLE